MRPVFYQRRFKPNLGISGKWVIRILLFCLVAFVAYRAYILVRGILDSSQSARLSAAAEALFQSRRTAEAMDELKIAVTLDPENIQAIRLMSRILDLQGSPQALEYHRLLEESGEAVPEDYRLMALSAARHNQLDRALFAAKAYSHTEGDRAFSHLVEARAHEAAGDPAAREKSLRAALSEREDAETLVALADFLLSDPEILDLNATEIAQLLRRAASIDNGPAGLRALRTGLARGFLSSEEFAAWLALYRSHPAADTTSRIDAASLEIAHAPSNSARVMESLLESFDNPTLAERIEAAQWFLAKGNSAAAQSVLPLESAVSDRQAFELWLESAAMLGRWSVIESALKSPSPFLPDTVRLPHLARSLESQNRASEAAALREDAVRRFSSDPPAFAETLRHFLATGEWELFEKNLPILVNDPRIGSIALQELVPVARLHRDSNRLLSLYEKTVRNPILAQDPFVLDRLQFNRLILGKPVAIEDIEFRLREAGDNPSFHVTAALGMLVNGRKAKALHLLEEGPVSIDPDALLPQQRAVYAAVLATNGRREEAARIASGIPRHLLTREEEVFLDRALAD